MISVTYLASLMLAVQLTVPGAIGLFPRSTFSARHSERIQEHALTVWPGPTGLVQAWESGELTRRQRIALLVGGAAFHDRQLLPVYIEASGDRAQTIRKAASYGYRMLLADAPPNLNAEIDDASAEKLAAEMRAMQNTLRQWPLAAVWLAALLHNEDSSLPGWRGVTLRRWPIQCLRALEVVAEPEDVDLLITAYSLSKNPQSRTSLLKIIEGLTLSQFIPKPLAEKGWGPEVYEAGHLALDEWWCSSWRLDTEERLRQSMEAAGAAGVEPFHPDSCHVWQLLLTSGISRWWELSSRELYRCGVPPKRISILRPDRGDSDVRRDALLRWLDPKPKPAKHTGRP